MARPGGMGMYSRLCGPAKHGHEYIPMPPHERKYATVIEILAQTTKPADNPGLLYSLTHGMFPLLMLMLVIMWFLMIAPKRKQDRQRQQMLGGMKRGDKVQTIGGVLGSVVEARDDRVLLKVDETSNTKMWFTRAAIAKVLEEDKAAPK